MQTKQLTLNNKTYTLHIAYQANERMRQAFNAMTFDFWEFTFEPYYQSGYWDDNCILFSLFEGEQLVAHTTLSLFTTYTADQRLHLGQLGTVMTLPSHTKQGLSRFLMESIFESYSDKLDGYFLFANDTVLEFYPKFDFHAVPEHQASKAFCKQPTTHTVQRLDLTDITDLQCFQHYLKNGHTGCRFDTRSYGLAHFYCYANPAFGYAESIYLIPELETLLIAQHEEDDLMIYQAYYLKDNLVDQAFNALADAQTNRVVLGYTPIDTGYTYNPYKEEDLTLFVSPALITYFEEQPTMIPLLSHT